MKDSNKLRLIFAIYIFTGLLATENVLVALIVDVVVRVSAFHVRLLVHDGTSNNIYAIHNQISFLWSPI